LWHCDLGDEKWIRNLPRNASLARRRHTSEK
jgi:hypothetical protein